MLPSLPESLAETPAKATVPLPVFDFREGMKNSWKLREAPRLSLDSRLRPREIRTTPAATYSPNHSDADSDKNRRSPSVVARLMGLDALPDAGTAVEPPKPMELRRSSSESRVSRDMHRFVDGSFLQKPPPPSDFAGDEIYKFRSLNFLSESKQAPPPTKQIQSQSQSICFQRRSYFNAQEFFPEPNRTGSRSLYGEIEKRLRMRGIDEPEKDLETLKQILEALQLKGLLHSNGKGSSYQQIEHQRRNLVSDRPIAVMKPGPRPVRRSDSEPPIPAAGRRNLVVERRVRSRSSSSSDPNPNPNPRSRPVNGEMNGRISPVHNSPRSSPRILTPDPVAARSPRNRRMVKERVCSPAEDDIATTISESSVSSSSHFDLERSRTENRAGRSLLERCDKLLNSIAAFTSAEQLTASDQQPSPVSVLDSSYLGEESSPSPVKKRSIEFKELEDEDMVPASPTSGFRPEYVPESMYSDFAYVSNVLLAYDRHRELSSGVYHFLEKHRGTADPSRESMLHRRLMFDTVSEILERKMHVSPWESFSRRRPASEGAQLIREVWAELRRSGEGVAAAEDINAAACRAIRKDMACGDHGWGDASAEMSDAVLHIERLVFKDLIGEMIRDLADLAGNKKIRNPLPRRKLLF